MKNLKKILNFFKDLISNLMKWSLQFIKYIYKLIQFTIKWASKMYQVIKIVLRPFIKLVKIMLGMNNIIGFLFKAILFYIIVVSIFFVYMLLKYLFYRYT